MVDRDHDHLAVVRQHRAVEPRSRAGATDPGAAVQPYHHRPFTRCPRCPNVEREAVLGDRLQRAVPGAQRVSRRGQLRRRRPKCRGVPHTGPGCGGSWREKAIRPGGGGGIRYALEAGDAIGSYATKLAACRFHDGGGGLRRCSCRRHQAGTGGQHGCAAANRDRHDISLPWFFLAGVSGGHVGVSTARPGSHHVALSLASDETRFVTGTEIVVDGGMPVGMPAAPGCPTRRAIQF